MEAWKQVWRLGGLEEALEQLTDHPRSLQKTGLLVWKAWKLGKLEVWRLGGLEEALEPSYEPILGAYRKQVYWFGRLGS